MSDRAQMRVTWWDRFLIGIAPSWGVRRVRAKAAASMLGRYYEAASGGRRTSGWHRSGADGNAAMAGSLLSLRELSRDLCRNNGWARRGKQTIANSTIGWGIIAKPVGPEGDQAARVTELWNAWADTPACDFDGRLNFYGLQRLVMETVVESGEALILRQPGDPGVLPVPVTLQVLEPDYLDIGKSAEPTIREGRPVSNRIVQGIEFDASGRRVAYWLFRNHPGGRGALSLESRRVPAENVLHVCRVERAGQFRGVPWLASAIARLQDFDDYSDAILMQQKIAACFSAFVQDFDGTASPIGQPDTEEPDKIEALEPGHIAYLPPGKSISFATPPGVADHAAFTSTNLRRVAVSIGITYEDLTGDYSQVNFSSARMARLAHLANVHDWRWNMMIPQFCDQAWRWVMELAAVAERWDAAPGVGWSPPPPPMLEPEKEGLAYQRLVRIGAMTLPEVIRERGGDFDAHLAEIADSNAKLDALRITLDSDPRRTSTAGQEQQGSSAPAAAPGEGERTPLLLTSRRR